MSVCEKGYTKTCVCFEETVSRQRKMVDTQELVGNQKSKVLEETENDI